MSDSDADFQSADEGEEIIVELTKKVELDPRKTGKLLKFKQVRNSSSIR